MKTFRLIRFVAVLLALNLVACAHEIPLDSGELADQDFSQEEMTAADAVESDSQEAALSEGEQIAETSFDDAAYEASLDGVQKDVEADFSADSFLAEPKAVAKENPAPIAARPAPQHVEKNRYYVVRAGDTAEYVSMLIYKDTSHAAKLTAWNGPSALWSAGKVIYYVSPKSPGDTRILSFYEERQLPTEDLTVQPGDSLAALAEKHLGSAASMKEIALVNGLKEEEPLQPGQVIHMYPSPLLGKASIKEQGLMAKATEVTAPTKAVPSPTVEPVSAVASAAPAAPVVVVNTSLPTQADKLSDRPMDSQAAPTVLEKSDTVRGPAIITLAPAPAQDAKPKASLASTLVASLFSRNPLVLGCTIAVLLLFSAFYYMHRGRNGSGFDI